jgi:DNA-binding XRE family transcriptional regulator
MNNDTDVTSGLDMARIIQQSRMKAKLTQKELAAVSGYTSIRRLM